MAGRRRIAWRYVVLVVPLVAMFVYYFPAALLMGLSSTALNPESYVSVEASVVSVGPGELLNGDEIEQARRNGDAEGLAPSEIDVPEPSYGPCTVTYTYVAGAETLTSQERDPRQSWWCDLSEGESVAVAYDPADATVVTDDYNATWNSMHRTFRIVGAVLLGTGLLGLVLVVRGHVHNARVRRAESARVPV